MSAMAPAINMHDETSAKMQNSAHGPKTSQYSDDRLRTSQPRVLYRSAISLADNSVRSSLWKFGQSGMSAIRTLAVDLLGHEQNPQSKLKPAAAGWGSHGLYPATVDWANLLDAGPHAKGVKVLQVRDRRWEMEIGVVSA
jgi:hypothetical protein